MPLDYARACDTVLSATISSLTESVVPCVVADNSNRADGYIPISPARGYGGHVSGRPLPDSNGIAFMQTAQVHYYNTM